MEKEKKKNENILYITGGFMNYFWVQIFFKKVENSYMEKKKKKKENILYTTGKFVNFVE